MEYRGCYPISLIALTEINIFIEYAVNGRRSSVE